VMAFLVGFLMGFMFTGSAFVLFATRRRKRREVATWTEDHYQPPVTTRVINKHRSIDL